ncbi:MAG: hypothetical protein WBM00_08705 [Solirubrobacterales bacterium]
MDSSRSSRPCSLRRTCSSSSHRRVARLVLIALLWFYLLSLALLAGATINSLRRELHDTGELPYASLAQ